MALDLSKLHNLKSLGGGEFQAACPCCEENGQDAKGNHLRIQKDGSYGCALAKKDKDHTKAIFRIAGAKNGDVSTIDFAPPSIEHPKLEIEQYFAESDLERLLATYSYWNGRGITDETLGVFKGGLSTQGKMKNRFCFPIYNADGKIHGMSGRWVLDDNHIDFTWKHLGLTTTWIYPLFFNKDEIKKKRFVILVESIGDMLTLWQNGVRNVLVVFGASISSLMLAKLVGLSPKKIFIATNNDTKHTVGQDAADKIKYKLDLFFDDSIPEIKLPPKKDFGICSPEDIQQYMKELNVNS